MYLLPDDDEGSPHDLSEPGLIDAAVKLEILQIRHALQLLEAANQRLEELLRHKKQSGTVDDDEDPGPDNPD